PAPVRLGAPPPPPTAPRWAATVPVDHPKVAGVAPLHPPLLDVPRRRKFWAPRTKGRTMKLSIPWPPAAAASGCAARVAAGALVATGGTATPAPAAPPAHAARPAQDA